MFDSYTLIDMQCQIKERGFTCAIFVVCFYLTTQFNVSYSALL